MRRRIRHAAVAIPSAFLVFVLRVLSPLHAQEPMVPPVDQETLIAFAKAHSAISEATIAFQFALAHPEGKTVEGQQRLYDAMVEQTRQALSEHGLTPETYREITFLVSASEPYRVAFAAALGSLAEADPG